jgi:hypothetical protein
VLPSAPRERLRRRFSKAAPSPKRRMHSRRELDFEHADVPHAPYGAVCAALSMAPLAAAAEELKCRGKSLCRLVRHSQAAGPFFEAAPRGGAVYEKEREQEQCESTGGGRLKSGRPSTRKGGWRTVGCGSAYEL